VSFSKGEKVTAKAHGGTIDIQGIVVATVNDKVQLQDVRVWYDPLDMFRQIAPDGVVKKDVVVDKKLSPDEALETQTGSSEEKPESTELPAGIEAKVAGLSLAEGGLACPFAGKVSKDDVAPPGHP